MEAFEEFEEFLTGIQVWDKLEQDTRYLNSELAQSE